MSTKHIAAVAEIEGINVTRKALLFCLAFASNLDGEWKLDRGWLRRASGLSERAVRDNLKWLQRRGFMVDLGGDYVALEL